VTRPRSAAAWAAALLLGVAAVSTAAALVVDLGFGLEVTPLHNPTDALEQQALRRLRDPRDDPAEIYGVPEAPLRAVVLDRRRLIRPPEAPERTLLVLDRALGADLLQARTVWRVALTVAAPALLLALALGLVARRARRRCAGAAGDARGRGG
jgi:hypothetical protein